MQKERNIVEGKYPKNCWNKIILMLFGKDRNNIDTCFYFD